MEYTCYPERIKPRALAEVSFHYMKFNILKQVFHTKIMILQLDYRKRHKKIKSNDNGFISALCVSHTFFTLHQYLIEEKAHIPIVNGIIELTNA
jgi:hypothetical protein